MSVSALLLLHERLDCGEERRDRYTGEDQRRGRALASQRAADGVGTDDREDRAPERREWEEIALRADRPVRDRHGRAQARPGRDAEQVGVRERVPEHALIRRTGHREHRAHERAERDTGEPELPDDRVFGRGQRRVDVEEREPGER